MTGELPDEPLKDSDDVTEIDVSIRSAGFDHLPLVDDSIQQRAHAARARAFSKTLERTIATLDTARYEAVEVITPQRQTGFGVPVQGKPEIRLVEQGAPYAEELVERGALAESITITRYDADDVETMRTYAQEAAAREELAVLERFVARNFDLPDEQVSGVAERIHESLRRYGGLDS